jgi:hypothetical protein
LVTGFEHLSGAEIFQNSAARGGKSCSTSPLFPNTTILHQMQLSKHAELIAVLTELWTLLDTLAIIKPEALQLPPSDTRLHPASSFHAEAALAAGFDPEAVAVMSALPYLHVDSDMGQRAIEIEGSTFPLSYLHFDKDDFADTRELFFDDENLIPSSAFRLTWQDVNGWEYIYDTKRSLLSSI